MYSLRGIVVLVIILGSVPACFVRPFYGVLMWTIISLLNPHRFAWNIRVPVAEWVAIPTLAGAALFTRTWKYVFSRDIWLLAVLWMWFTITTLVNKDVPMFAHFAPSTWFRWTFVSKILLMALVAVALVDTWSRLRWLLLVTAGSIGFFVVKAIPFMIRTGGAAKLYGPDGSMLADNNDLGLALNMTLPLFFFLAQTASDRRMKWMMWGMFVCSIPAVFFTYSRGALLGLVTVLFLMVMRLRQRFVLMPVLALACLFAVMFTPENWRYRMDFRRDGAVLDSSARARLEAWKFSWNLALDNPIIGAGFEPFTAPLYSRYNPSSPGVYGPHSIYFGVLAEHGFVGLFLYLTVVGSCFLTLRRLGKYGRMSGNIYAANYAPMLQFSLIAFLVSGSFLGRAYFDYYFSIVAFTAMLNRVCRFEAEEMYAEETVMEEPFHGQPAVA